MLRAKLQLLAPGVAMAAPSPRVRIIWHHENAEEHVIAYLGFDNLQAAQACYAWMVSHVGRFDRYAGVCKPRPAKRVTGCAFEIKWHKPNPVILRRAIEKDLARTNSTN